MAAVQWSIDWRSVVPGAKVLGTPGYLTGISHDSRQVQPGHAFVAVRGAQQDGHDYLESALQRGASLLVVQQDSAARWRAFKPRVPIVVVESTRAALGPVSSAVYDHPSRRLAMVGVTGTDGKTTTTQLTAHVLGACGIDAGYLSTNGFRTAGREEKNDSHMTTVEATLLQSRLRDAVLNGKKGMVLEASSEGLAQHRLDGCEFDVGVFTNLTRDHLDFHGTMAAYLQAKGRLFQMLDGPRTKPRSPVAVLNRDDPASETLAEMTRSGVIWYGLHEDADLTARDIRTEGFDTSFTLEGAGECATVRSRMPGRFNVYNCLAAIAAAKALDIDACEAAGAIESFQGIPGRLERIDRGQPFDLVLDSASTPASLMTVLELIRPLVRGKLVVVIGAPGGRDKARRPGLARASGRFADLTLLTSDDPRHEDPEAILDDMAEGLRAMGQTEGSDFLRVLDRAEAIRVAVEFARPGDTIVLAGKPNETTMLIGDEELPWDERKAALDALAAAGVR